MNRARNSAFPSGIRVTIALVLVAGLLVLGGCDSKEATTDVNPMMDTGGDPNVQICRYCSQTALPDSEGTAVLVDGKQVARISIESGSWVPNRITASAGTPITLEFTAVTPAKGCITMPTIEDLGKKGNLPQGTGTFELGVLEPGEYPMTCGMGSSAGVLIVE